MSIRTACPYCYEDYNLADSLAGKTIRCRACRETFPVPATDSADDAFLAADSERETADSEDAGADFWQAMSNPDARRARSSRPADAGATIGASSRSMKPRSSSAGKWIAIVLGAAGGLLLLCCGGVALIGWYVNQALEVPPASAEASQPFPVETLRIPALPELGTPEIVEPTEVALYAVDFAPANPGNFQPAAQMQMRVYVPPGEHAPQSLGCVFVAPAGTNLLSGNAIDDGEYHAETLPYAQAGYVVVHYCLDGPLSIPAEAATIQDIAPPYGKFSAAHAGLANSRAALEFVLARLPQVDPKRLFAAGHSSAAVLAMLFAEHEPRLKGCIAYAPVVDVEESLDDVVQNPFMRNQLPGLVDFVRRSSPSTHLSRLKCPLFVFYAQDDREDMVEPWSWAADSLKQQGTVVTIETVPTGGHYEPMVQTGIPRAIEWLKGLPGEGVTDQAE